MKIKMSVLAVALALSLAACSDKSSPAVPAEVAPSSTAALATAPQAEAQAPAPSMPATMPVASAPASADASGDLADETATIIPSTSGPRASVVTNCATEIEGNDAMQFSALSIVVPASCKDFTITLKHTGRLPATVMGHDVVITKESDVQAVDADGVAAGAVAGYVNAADPRVIAHTSVIGGGETTSVSFPASKIQGNGPFAFFCSFPGHSALMHGSISVK